MGTTSLLTGLSPSGCKSTSVQRLRAPLMTGPIPAPLQATRCLDCRARGHARSFYTGPAHSPSHSHSLSLLSARRPFSLSCARAEPVPKPRPNRLLTRCLRPALTRTPPPFSVPTFFSSLRRRTPVRLSRAYDLFFLVLQKIVICYYSAGGDG